MTGAPPTLIMRMRALADQREKEYGGHPDEAVDDLRAKADALEAAANGFFNAEQTKTPQQFLGAYARAKLLFCRLTGEALV